MGAGALLFAKQQLDRFNEAFSTTGLDVDLSQYAAPVLVLYLGLNFIPTAIGLTRHCEGLRKIIAWNTAVPIALLAVSVAFKFLPDMAVLRNLVLSIAGCAGIVMWISTMIDATASPASASEEN